jgi:hypothetical protein
VPTDAKVRDWIAIFPGGNLPFVIRNTVRNEFILVGHCYVHGVMDGEMLLRMEIVLGTHGVSLDNLFKEILLV